MENSGQSRFAEGQIQVPDNRVQVPLDILERQAARKEWNSFMLNLSDYCFKDCVKPPYNEPGMKNDEKQCMKNCIRQVFNQDKNMTQLMEGIE